MIHVYPSVHPSIGCLWLVVGFGARRCWWAKTTLVVPVARTGDGGKVGDKDTHTHTHPRGVVAAVTLLCRLLRLLLLLLLLLREYRETMSRGDQRERDRAKNQAKQQAKAKQQSKVRDEIEQNEKREGERVRVQPTPMGRKFEVNSSYSLFLSLSHSLCVCMRSLPVG